MIPNWIYYIIVYLGVLNRLFHVHMDQRIFVRDQIPAHISTMMQPVLTDAMAEARMTELLG